MKLSGRTDIGAPVAFVYAALSDFEGWERSAMRRGADVNRTDKLRVPGVGMTLLDFERSGIGGTASDIKIQAEQMLYTKNKMAELIAAHTGQTLEQIQKDSDRDRRRDGAAPTGGTNLRSRDGGHECPGQAREGRKALPGANPALQGSR